MRFLRLLRIIPVYACVCARARIGVALYAYNGGKRHKRHCGAVPPPPAAALRTPHALLREKESFDFKAGGGFAQFPSRSKGRCGADKIFFGSEPVRVHWNHTMARKSFSELTLVPPYRGDASTRPPPPADLDVNEKRLWLELVNSAAPLHFRAS